ncbi:tyrosine-type recombinase/integrase [Pararhodobacter sp. CCB-MM2]|uniref:tyrosine-type recombinase/integrase n=1 Tax=Pararhodobacter sp. CCB-MM2 TaxID=1786003 RepID=UPI00350F0E85
MWDEDGKRRRFRLSADTRKEAEREARDKILTIQAPAAGMTVAQIWHAYKAEMGERRQASKLDQVGRNVLPELGHLSAEAVSPDDCRAYVAGRREEGRKDATIRTEMGCLRAAVLWAERAKLIKKAPAIEMPPAGQPRERYLSRDEFAALLAGAQDPHIRLALLLMLTTAGRIGALLELEWRQVDLDRRIIRLAKGEIGPKKGRATVPINDTLMAALTAAREAAVSDYVIEWGGRPVGSIKTGFNAAVTRAGIEHCTPHDIRRTAGRFMVENGVPIEEVAQFLGHTNPAVTRSTYAKFSPEFLRQAAGSLELAGPVLVQRTRKRPAKKP